MNRLLCFFVAIAGLGTLASGCADYEFTVNEKVVYTPLPLFTDYQIADSGLANCVGQTINDQKITRAEELLVLRCTHAGIVSLDGLERFNQLQSLDLQHNHISNTQVLGKLENLQEIRLAHNQLRAVNGLELLPKLLQLDLEDNPELDCKTAARLAQKKKLQLNLPAQCP